MLLLNTHTHPNRMKRYQLQSIENSIKKVVYLIAGYLNIYLSWKNGVWNAKSRKNGVWNAKSWKNGVWNAKSWKNGVWNAKSEVNPSA